ncbi:PilZ domain-containing protein [Sphingomonas immobilis]|uniref:PilZ domain-containing protein n=1 Tax=Sphingomonas immobilis TaxID=3063997 RepID=A0ABT8ZYM2_9SPHN|nr:PilZ domain-containing protein [Sphingomonas sp. CA1-15]MDO7841866.1 PilZ domain-containing protein [Sphingomonas sp. CA1-15]
MNCSSSLADGLTTDRRDARRLKAFAPTRLVDITGVRRAHVLNISSTGALLYCVGGADPRGVVTFDLPGMSINAAVQWVLADRFGVKFSVAVDTRDLATSLQQGQ